MKTAKKLLLPCLLVLSAAASAQAQTRAAYRFDNFDTAAGVPVVAPPAPPAAQRKRRVRLNSNVLPSAAASPEASLPAPETRPRIALGMAAKNSLDGYTTGDAEVDGHIVASGRRNGVDPVLLYAIMHRESAFKKHAVSYKGARGLMQLMPATARRFGVTSIFDPRQNIEAGAKYMRFLLDRFDGDVRLALAGYNAGEGAVEKYGRRVPPYSETREYVRRIGERYALMRNPEAARRAPVVNAAQVAQIKQRPAEPVTYERNVYQVRLPNGQLMLVSQ
ncbi:MAG TPA: lytic transglycosylase domain-containing protein [Pyrinomonadaceae bacterium]|nr:lytic transglycosylase domain-containing protein [Pyrinomonadaceae bacterium]